MKIKIPHRWNYEPCYVAEVSDDSANPMRDAVEQAVARGARLDGASLVSASLDGARLDGASLDGASLVNASLDGARLVNASLDGASLDGASLDGARLDGARLVSASLDGIRDDFWSVLDTSPAEVPGLLAKLRAGEIDGSQYQGECVCLVGTIGNLRHLRYDEIPDLVPNSDRPSERWFLAIRRGVTPDNHQVAAITDDWINEWMAMRGEGEWMSDADLNAMKDDEMVILDWH